MNGLRESWWLVAVRGVLALAFGLVAIVSRVTLGEVVLLFGLYVFLDGLGAIVSGLRSGVGVGTSWPLLLEGTVSVVLGVRLPKPSTGQWCLALSGASSVLIGMLPLGLPAAGLASVVRLLGLYAFVFGALILVAAFRLRAGRGVLPSRLAEGVGRP